MSSVRKRAREMFPQVLLTLLSIIQALALELLWSKLGESPHLWAGGLPALIGWLQVVAVVQGILLIWLFYTGMVMRFVWLPSTRDSLFPFAIGLLEFNMIESMGPEKPALWLLAMALTFVVSRVASASTIARAREEPENTRFFEKAGLDAETLSTLLPMALFVAAMLLAAALVAYVGGYGWLVFSCVAGTNAALFAQTLFVRSYWRDSMRLEEG